MTNEQRVRLWDEINRYVVACGGDPSKNVYGNTVRQTCVANIESTIRDIESASVSDAADTLGRAWMFGGATLAEGIRRKTAAMERIAEPIKRKRPKATITVESMDGVTETTVYGGER